MRPHLKTAKSPEVARLLLDAGAAGICVAKLSEAEVMLAAGIDDVLITTRARGPVKVGGWRGWSPAGPRRACGSSSTRGTARRRSTPRCPAPLETLIDVNVGQDRCGVAPEDALALADRCAASIGCAWIGLQGYEGNLQHVRDPRERERSATARWAVGGGGASSAPPGMRSKSSRTGGTGHRRVLRGARVRDRGPARIVRVHGRRLPGHRWRSV